MKCTLDFNLPTLRQRYKLQLTVDDLTRLFVSEPEKFSVGGSKADMVAELIKMLYFDYDLETEVRIEFESQPYHAS